MPTGACSSTLRQTFAEVDLEAISHNIAIMREKVAPAAVMGVVKSNGYGHGALEAARAALAGGATWLGVATADEALTLREAGISQPILVFGPILGREAPDLIDQQIDLAVGSASLLREVIALGKKRNSLPRIHVQIDTGIGRDGVRPDDLEFLEVLLSEKTPLAGLWTHYAVSDSFALDDIEFTRLQTSKFRMVLTKTRSAGLRPIGHAANSGAILRHDDTTFDMVRPGISTYGCDPAGPVEPVLPLRQALTLKSSIAQIKWMEPGDTISYGRMFTVPDRRRIAIVVIGYGDGYPRILSNAYHVLIRGRKAPIRGRVCMDQIMVDLSEIPEAELGDEVVIYGRQGSDEIRLEAAAEAASTISYELTCQLTPRIPRVYVGGID